MEKIEILISTINQEHYEKLISKMNINGNCIMINQIIDNKLYLPEPIINEKIKFLSYKERGLSISRNKAIQNADATICVIADDDMYYENDIEHIVLEAYKKHPDADIIAFDVDNEDKSNRKKILRSGKVHFIKSMKISSVQITFKKDSILKNNIKFKENFGAGAQYYFGEENIFLSECLRKKLKIYYEPQKIATLIANTESTWSKDSTPEHWNIQGMVYYEMSKLFYPLLILQFAIRKRSLYINTITTWEIIKYMFDGVRKYKNGGM